MIKYDSRRLLETVTSVFKVVQHSLNACNGPEMADPQSGGELVGSRKSSRQGHSVSEHPTEQSSSQDHSATEHPGEQSFSQDHSATEHPAEQSFSQDHSATEHLAEQSSSKDHSATEHPAEQSPNQDHSVSEHPAEQSSSQNHLATEHPAEQSSSQDHSATEHPAEQSPNQDHSVSEHPAEQSSSQNHLATEHPAEQSSSQDHSATEHPAEQSPNQDHSVSEHPAEQSSSQNHLATEHPAEQSSSQDHSASEHPAEQSFNQDHSVSEHPAEQSSSQNHSASEQSVEQSEPKSSILKIHLKIQKTLQSDETSRLRTLKPKMRCKNKNCQKDSKKLDSRPLHFHCLFCKSHTSIDCKREIAHMLKCPVNGFIPCHTVESKTLNSDRSEQKVENDDVPIESSPVIDHTIITPKDDNIDNKLPHVDFSPSKKEHVNACDDKDIRTCWDQQSGCIIRSARKNVKHYHCAICGISNSSIPRLKIHVVKCKVKKNVENVSTSLSNDKSETKLLQSELICADSGIYLVRRGTQGPAAPIHVKVSKKGWECTAPDCKDMYNFHRGSLNPAFMCIQVDALSTAQLPSSPVVYALFTAQVPSSPVVDALCTYFSATLISSCRCAIYCSVTLEPSYKS